MSSPPFPASDRWFHLLLRVYPPDFRDEMGGAIVDAYHDRAGEAFTFRGRLGLGGVWMAVLVDSVRNSLGERMHPGERLAASRRPGARSRTGRPQAATAPGLLLDDARHPHRGTRDVRGGVHGVDKILLEPLPFRDPGEANWPCGWRWVPRTVASSGSWSAIGPARGCWNLDCRSRDLSGRSGAEGISRGRVPFDAATLVAVTLGLALVALLACYAAARPISSIEPERLLRDA